jgi:cyclase
MLIPRIIPCLLLYNDFFVKTKKFKKIDYIGDPINTVNLFNKFEVDELIILDIGCARYGVGPNIQLIEKLSAECWIPITYGGGIRKMEQANEIFNSGVEKIVLDSVLHDDPEFVKSLVRRFGSSSIVATVNVKSTWLDKNKVYTHAGKKKCKTELEQLLFNIEQMGAGEILLNAIDRDGVMSGYNLELVRHCTKLLNIPLIVCGGASSITDFKQAIHSGASAAAAGSMFVYQKSNAGVLINYPERKELESILL